MKCSFLDYVQLLMISWDGRWTRTPSAPYSIRKVGFCLSCNFSNLFPLKWLRTANFIRFATFPVFSHRRDSEWPILPDLQLFQSFSTKVAQIMRQCRQPPPPWNGAVGIQISVGTWSSTWMMIFTSWQSRLFVMEIVTLQLNLTNYTYFCTLYHNFVTIHPI